MVLLTLIKLFLQEAITPEEFLSHLHNALMQTSSPQERNKAIALSKHTKPESSNFVRITDKVKHQVYDIVSSVFPGAFVVYGRKKSILSFLQKLANREVLNDAYALRVILSDAIIGIDDSILLSYRVVVALILGLQNCGYEVRILETIEQIVPEEILSEIHIPSNINISESFKPYFRNYTQFPSKRGYQGLHVLIVTPEGIPVEIQIRTTTQHNWAEFGKAKHDGSYKEESDIDQLVQSKGTEFVKKLYTPVQVGEPLYRDTATDKIPHDMKL